MRARLATLSLYLPVLLAWAAVWLGGGFGVRGSGLYVDPTAEPGAFLSAIPLRLVLLAGGELGAPGADAWLVIASAIGAARHPAWLHNLAKQPDAVVQFGDGRRVVFDWSEPRCAFKSFAGANGAADDSRRRTGVSSLSSRPGVSSGRAVAGWRTVAGSPPAISNIDGLAHSPATSRTLVECAMVGAAHKSLD